MKNIYIILIILAGALSFTSCIEDVNVKQTFDIDAKLVLFSRICPQVDTNFLFLYNSIPFFSNQQSSSLHPISKAVVEISSDKENWTRFTFDDERDAFILLKDAFVIEEGSTYYIRAACNGYETVTSSCTVPYMREVNLRMQQKDTTNQYNPEYQYIKNTYTWTDFPNEENFYVLYGLLYRYYAEIGYDIHGNVYYGDTVLRAYLSHFYDNGEYVITDEGRDGEDISVSNLYRNDSEEYTMSDTIRFFMLDRCSYLYELSMVKYENSMGVELLTLFEPIILYSNIENGLGFFGAFSTRMYHIPDILE